MSLLTDPLKRTVIVGGEEVPIHWDFRTSIKFSELILDPELSEQDKLIKGLKLYYDDDVLESLLSSQELIVEALSAITDFYSYHPLSNVRKKKKGRNENKTKPLSYSYEYDSNYIYAAFYEQYNLDLCVADLHWWQFKALFEGLKEDTLISKIIYYRTLNISDVPDEQRSHYRKLKREFALPEYVSEKEQKALDELTATLAGDGKLSKFGY